jgi:NAD(P)-dependent dehydrogenase (short-subunit alcohol dehydrogenase family)
VKTLNDKVAVVTGAASGIGRALAVGLAGEGCALAIADINEEGLNETARMVSEQGREVMSRIVDVSRRDEVHAFADAVVERFGRVDVVINNAGVTVIEIFKDFTYDDFEWNMGINFWGVVYGSKAFLPHLMKQPEGHLVNVSSAFGLIGFPSETAYCASKFGVRGFSEALARELERTSVAVSCVYPGGVKTNVVRNSRYHQDWMGRKDKDLAAKEFERMAKTTPEQAARVIIDGIKKKRERILIGSDAKIIDIIQRLFPARYSQVLRTLFRLS